MSCPTTPQGQGTSLYTSDPSTFMENARNVMDDRMSGQKTGQDNEELEYYSEEESPIQAGNQPAPPPLWPNIQPLVLFPGNGTPTALPAPIAVHADTPRPTTIPSPKPSNKNSGNKNPAPVGSGNKNSGNKNPAPVGSGNKNSGNKNPAPVGSGNKNSDNKNPSPKTFSPAFKMFPNTKRELFIKAAKVSKKSTLSLKASSFKKRPSPKKHNYHFHNAIHRVNKIINPSMQLSKRATLVINDLLGHVFEKLATEAGRLSAFAKKSTLQMIDVQTSTKLNFPGQLGPHAVAEAHKSCQKFYMA